MTHVPSEAITPHYGRAEYNSRRNIVFLLLSYIFDVTRSSRSIRAPSLY
jgi:hypothetical protein